MIKTLGALSTLLFALIMSTVSLGHTFGLTQFASGVEFAGLLRFGFQGFFGRAPALGITKAEISKWHLVVEIVPKKKS